MSLSYMHRDKDRQIILALTNIMCLQLAYKTKLDRWTGIRYNDLSICTLQACSHKRKPKVTSQVTDITFQHVKHLY